MEGTDRMGLRSGRSSSRSDKDGDEEMKGIKT